nr:GATOR complex protein NPRL3-like [Ciona intestinalis]XP_009858314.1 GATOR complex protein NPRL3-like [Ciona intestinalis]|eukprot:XP_002130884.1 GATOR complex protein NPRL3-like [Ciona intestinalis]
MDDDLPWNPLGLMLSMFGSRINSKLLFKYPFDLESFSGMSRDNYEQLTSSTFHLNQPHTMGGQKSTADWMNEEDSDDEQHRDTMTQFLAFSDETLGQILSPGNTKICGQKFDVKNNGLRFVGFPVMLERSNIEGNMVRPMQHQLVRSGRSRCNSSAAFLRANETDTTLLSFNLVFVLKTSANYSVVEAYQQLSAKVSLGLRFEEKRTMYMTNAAMQMLSIHDDEANTEESKCKIYSEILAQSKLALHLQDIFNALHCSGTINLTINENLSIDFCLYHKVLNSTNVSEQCSTVDIKAIETCLKKIQPYHGLLVYDIKDVWASLTDHCSMSMVKFLNFYSPTKSLQLISIDGDINLKHVYTIARHLVLWGKACVIYPLCKTNVYVLAPTAMLHIHSRWVKLFRNTFHMSLTKVLSYFSVPISLIDFRLGERFNLQSHNSPFFEHEDTLVNAVFWMLQHRFLMQHHTYVYFVPPLTTKEEAQKSSIELQHDLLKFAKTVHKMHVRFEDLPSHCKPLFQTSITASQAPINFNLFLRLLKYFDGRHHLEEMMYRENLLRGDIVNILDQFKPLLLTTVREDEIASAFCMADC